ncbi:MAG: TraR/DksA family transcriptional regulator [Chitinophagales bacterium]
MTAAEIEVFTKKITTEIEKVKKDIIDLKELTKPIPPENSLGRITRMDAINNKSVNEANLRRSRRKLSKLQQALHHVDKPDFGKCMSCKRQIQIGRLMFMPESNRCIRCAR